MRINGEMGKQKKEIWLTFLGIFIIIFPFIMVCCFALMANDDFDIDMIVRQDWQNFHSLLVPALKHAYSDWKNWNGDWLGNFLLYFLAPFRRGGIWGLRFLMIAVVVMYTGTITLVSVYLLKKYLLSENIFVNLGVVLSILYLSVNLSMPTENFWWYAGICQYTIPFIVGMLGIYFLISASGCRSRFIIANILLFFSTGGSLQITAFVCFNYLIICCIYWLNNMKRKKEFLLGFLFVLCGGLLNVAAPGHWKRYGMSQAADVNFSQTIISTFLWVGKAGGMIISSGFGIGILLLLFLIGIYVGRKGPFRFNYVGLVALVSVLGVSITNFPVIMGASVMDQRNMFMMGVYASLYFGSACFYIGGTIGKSTKKKVMKVPFIAGILVCILEIVLFSIAGSNSMRCIKAVENGTLKLVSNGWEETLDYLEKSPEKEVILYIPEYLRNDIIKVPTVGENPDDLLNPVLAKYYGKESISFIYE